MFATGPRAVGFTIVLGGRVVTMQMTCDPPKKKPGQKQPTMVGLTRAINAGSTFCGAQSCDLY